MSPLKTAGFVAGLTVLVTAGVLHLLGQARQREAWHLQAENQRLRLEAQRRVVAASAVPVAASLRAPESAAGTPASAAPPPAPGLAAFYRDEGNATPRAALQTFAWACDRGDVATVQRLLFVEEAARPKVAAYLATLPEAVRQQWPSADAMVAGLLTQQVMASPFPRAEVLDTATPEPVSDGRVRLRLLDLPWDGTEFHQGAEGWRYVLTERAVDAYLAARAGAAR